MKKIIIPLIGIVVWIWATLPLAAEDLEIKGRQLVSQKPPFTLTLPSEFRLIHSFSQDIPKENSLTRTYLFIKEKSKQVEEILIVQIADKTNPQAGPMTAPPLTPFTEKRLYLKERKKKGEYELDFLIQLIGWNPDAPTLQPIKKKGIALPSHWALQGQFLFIYQGEHAVLARYSKDANSFGLKVSESGDRWDKGSIAGNEKKVCEIFQKTFTEMIGSIRHKNP